MASFSPRMVAVIFVTMCFTAMFSSYHVAAQPNCANLDVQVSWVPLAGTNYYDFTVRVVNTCLKGPLFCTLSNIHLTAPRYNGPQFTGDIQQNYKDKTDFIVKGGGSLGPQDEAVAHYYWQLPALQFTVSSFAKSCNGI